MLRAYGLRLALVLVLMLMACSAPAGAGPRGTAAAFAAWLAAADGALEAEFRGSTQRDGGDLREIAGTYRCVGDDVELVLRTRSGADWEPASHCLADGQNYLRSGSEAWYAVDGAALSGGLATTLAGADWHDAGAKGSLTELRSLDLDLAMVAGNLGLTDGSSVDGAGAILGEAVLRVARDGRLAEMVVDIEQPSRHTAWSVTYTFAAVANSDPIAAPADALRTCTSTANRFWSDVPASWTHRSPSDQDPWDAFRLPTGEQFYVVRHTFPEALQDPEAFLDEYSAYQCSAANGPAIDSMSDLDVNGLPGSRMSGTSTDEDGEVWFYQEVALLAGDDLYRVQWYSAPGDEEADAAKLLNLVEGLVLIPDEVTGPAA